MQRGFDDVDDDFAPPRSTYDAAAAGDDSEDNNDDNDNDHNDDDGAAAVAGGGGYDATDDAGAWGQQPQHDAMSRRAAAPQPGQAPPASSAGGGGGGGGDEDSDEENAEAARLGVPAEVRALFKLVRQGRPHALAGAPEPPPPRLRPFLPDYVPALGPLDAFVKVPRPDGRRDGHGLTVVDEPAWEQQSDPAALRLRLRRQLGRGGGAAAAGARCEPLGALPPGKEQHARLGAWLASAAELRRGAAAGAAGASAAVGGGLPAYSKPMPDLDSLMAEWPPQLDAALRASRLPDADAAGLDLAAFARLVCALLDVPVHNTAGCGGGGCGALLESLHLLFSLLLELQANPFLAGRVNGGGGSGLEPVTAGN